MAAAVPASLGPTLGRVPTDAAIALSFGPPSERTAGWDWSMTELLVLDESPSSVSTSTIAAPANSASSAPSSAVRVERWLVGRETTGCEICDMTDLL